MQQYLIFLLFVLVGIPLIRASYSDLKTRKISVKIWYPAVYIALPIAMILFGLDIWNGVINVSYEYYSFPIIYSIIMIFILGVIAHSEKYIKMGGADYIALTVIIITLISINLYLSPIYFILFFVFSLITIIYAKYKKESTNFIIPLIVTISLAYFFTIGFYLIRTNLGTLPLV